MTHTHTQCVCLLLVAIHATNENSRQIYGWSELHRLQTLCTVNVVSNYNCRKTVTFSIDMPNYQRTTVKKRKERRQRKNKERETNSNTGEQHWNGICVSHSPSLHVCTSHMRTCLHAYNAIVCVCVCVPSVYPVACM